MRERCYLKPCRSERGNDTVRWSCGKGGALGAVGATVCALDVNVYFLLS